MSSLKKKWIFVSVRKPHKEIRSRALVGLAEGDPGAEKRLMTRTRFAHFLL